MKQIVTIDIGGTHVRFAIAELDGRAVASLGEATTFLASDHAQLLGGGYLQTSV
jgi:glucokinase